MWRLERLQGFETYERRRMRTLEAVFGSAESLLLR
jgi:hypothetical protein